MPTINNDSRWKSYLSATEYVEGSQSETNATLSVQLSLNSSDDLGTYFVPYTDIVIIAHAYDDTVAREENKYIVIGVFEAGTKYTLTKSSYNYHLPTLTKLCKVPTTWLTNSVVEIDSMIPAISKEYSENYILGITNLGYCYSDSVISELEHTGVLRNDGQYVYGFFQEEDCNINGEVSEIAFSVTIGDIEYVDLRLPSGTIWAKYNIGATSENLYGSYYQYGKGTRQYAVTSGESYYSVLETPLATSADTVAQEWGGDWHMPRIQIYNELISYTRSEWTTIDGVNGMKFTSLKDSSKYIFLPAGGYWSGGSQSNLNSRGAYWSSTSSDLTFAAYKLDFNSGRTNTNCMEYRTDGISVRGVMSGKSPYGKIIYLTNSAQTNSSTTISTNGCGIDFVLSGNDITWLSNIEATSSNRLSFTASENDYIERSVIIRPKIDNTVCEDEGKWVLVTQESGCDCGTGLEITTPTVVLTSAKTNSNYATYVTTPCFETINSIQYEPSSWSRLISATTEPSLNRIKVTNIQNSINIVEKSGTVIVNYSEAEGCEASTSFTVVRKSGCGCQAIYKYNQVSDYPTEINIEWNYNSTTASTVPLVGYTPNPTSATCYSSVTTSFTSSNLSHWIVSGITAPSDPQAPFDYEIKVQPKENNNDGISIEGTFIIEYMLRDGNPGATCQFIVHYTHNANSCINTFKWK